MVLGIRERTGRSVTPKTDRTSVQLSIKSRMPNLALMRSAIQFESFVVMAKNHVRGCTNKMLLAYHDAMVEAMLWNSTLQLSISMKLTYHQTLSYVSTGWIR
jgi:hypothetical protein